MFKVDPLGRLSGLVRSLVASWHVIDRIKACRVTFVNMGSLLEASPLCYDYYLHDVIII